MKLILNRSIWMMISFLLLEISCSITEKINQEECLEVFYVPFEMSTEGKLFESEVRDLSIPYVSYFCTSNTKLLDEFKEELMSNSSGEPEEVIKDVAPYMIIDFLPDSENYQKVIIGPSVFFKVGGKVYLMSKEFNNWINNNIPEATFPTGSRISTCSS